MTIIRLAGGRPGENIGTVSVTADGTTESTSVTSFRKPTLTGVPRLMAEQYQNQAMEVDVTGLTGITAYDWREQGGSTFSTTNPITASEAVGFAGDLCEVAVTCDQGTLVSPPFRPYTDTMMGNQMPASHTADDKAILALIPHSDCTHIADTTGDWTDTATWKDGVVPGDGSVVLIQDGVTVTYDNAEANIRLDRVRVDGTLTWPLDQSTTMTVETLVVTRFGEMIIGTSSGRIPAQYRHDIIISGIDYSANTYTQTDLKSDNFLETRGWGRGVVCQGTMRIWGAEKTTWFKAEPIDQGATSLTFRPKRTSEFEHTLTGLEVGDTIVILGTEQTYTYVSDADHAPSYEDEERVITAINGNVISWTDPLVYPHKNQLPGSTRTDLYPNVLVRRNKNVCFTSEVTDDVSRRGHFAVMHHWATLDIWDAEFFELGRTDKSAPAGVINSSNQFEFAVENNEGARQTAALTSRSNIQGRYNLHCHLLGGMGGSPRNVLVNCAADGSPGWPIVHHDADIDVRSCVSHRFFGTGIVAEAGSETGAWIDNLSAGTTWESREWSIGGGWTDATNAPKNMSKGMDEHGDLFRHGFGFGFRGRGVRQVGNVTNSVTYGRAWLHRKHADGGIVPPLNPDRALIDIPSQKLMRDPNDALDAGGEFEYVDLPILHSADEESVAVMAGTFVTKSEHTQSHDVNVRFKRHKAWGYQLFNAGPEYIGVYILEDFDSVAGKNYRNSSSGIVFGANVHEVAFTRFRSEGNLNAIFVQGNDTTGSHDNYNATTRPRWMAVGIDSVNDQNLSDGVDPTTNAGGDITYSNGYIDAYYEEVDPDNSELDYDAIPSFDAPALVCEADDFSNTRIDNTYRKTDNLSEFGKLVSKDGGDGIFWTTGGSGGVTTYRGGNGFGDGGGYYNVTSTDTDVNGLPCVITTYIISDRLTARPKKYSAFADITNVIGGGTLKGSFTYSETAVVQSDFEREVSANGSVTFDVVTGATGGGTVEIDGDFNRDALDGDMLAPDHGTLTLDVDNDEVTYTPDPDYAGTDECFIFLKSQGQYATVRLDFLVGGDAATLDTPVVTTNFAAAAHATETTLEIELFEQPDAGGRRIRDVEYSTDNGSTWRRLCYGWVKACHEKTEESDGTTLTGGTYNVKIRYKTDYDYSTSTASDAVSVGITGGVIEVTDPGTISGSYEVGEIITASSPTASDFGVAFTYQWQRDGVDIPGATSETYLLGPDDGGASIRRQATATNGTGSDTEASNAVTVSAFEEEADFSTIFKGSNVTITNGTQAATSASSNHVVHIDKAVLAGKFYFEVVIPSGAHNAAWIGATRMSYDVAPGNSNAAEKSDFTFCRMDSGVAGPANFGTNKGPNIDTSGGDVFYCAIDVENKLIWFGSESDGWTGDPAAGTGGFDLFDLEPVVVAISPRHASSTAFTLRSLSADFTGTVPSGFTPYAEIESSAVVDSTPAASDTILDKHGINMKLSFRSGANGSFPPAPWPLTVYNWVPEMVILGFRHIRTLVGKNNAAHADLKTLYDRTGIKVTSRLVSKTSSGGNFPTFPVADIDEILGKHETESGLEIVHAFEGGNEVDDGKNYAGWAQASVDSQEYMFDAINAKPALDGLPILGPSVWRRNETSINAMVTLGLHDFCDTAAPHVYAGNDRPTLSSIATGANVNNLDVQPTYLKRAIESAATIAPDGSEVWVTETGPENESDLFGQSLGDRSMVPEAVAAKYYLRDLMEMFRYGVDMVFMYALFDNNLQSTKNTYGLLSWPNDQNAVRRPTFYSAMRLNSLVKDLATFTPTPLRMTLTGNLSEVGHAVYQKSSGNYLLMIWQDCQTFDTQNTLTISHPTRTVTLQLDATASTIRRYEPSVDGAVTTPGSSVSSLSLVVPDHVVVYEICFNDTVAAPEYGLVPDELFEPDTAIAYGDISGGNDVVFSADFTGLDGSSGGRIFVTGNGIVGSYVGFRANGDFVARCGKANVSLPDDEVGYVIVPAADAPSGDGSLVVEFLTGVNAVRVWWNGEPLGTPVDRASGSQFWSSGASVDGAYLNTGGEDTTGEINTTVTYTTATDLKYHDDTTSAL